MLHFQTIVTVLLILGISFIAIGIAKSNSGCPKVQTVYKYIPQTFELKENYPTYPSILFDAMFNQPTPWIVSLNDEQLSDEEQMRRYFRSQI